MARDIKTLSCYPQQYYERYSTMQRYGYVAGREEKSIIKEVMGMMDSSENFAIRVLALGPGNGLNDVVIIETLSNTYKDITYVIVEPDNDELRNFKSLIASKCQQGQWKNVDFQFHQSTANDYLEDYKMEDVSSNGKFDIIHAQLCAFHFLDPPNTIVDFCSFLKEKGMLFVTKGAANDFIRMYKKASELLNIPRKVLCSNRIVEVVARSLPHVQIQRKIYRRKVKVAECFKVDSEDGNKLLDFTVQVYDIRNRVTKEEENEIMSLLRSLCEMSDNGPVIDCSIECLFIKCN